MVFGFFSNAQRFISDLRYGDKRHQCDMFDITVASMMTGLVSVSLGAPVDLIKIRLQMQTQPILARKTEFETTTFETTTTDVMLFLVLAISK